MKLFEQLKSNASRMAVYAILLNGNGFMRNRGTRLCAQRGERRCRTRVHGFDG